MRQALLEPPRQAAVPYPAGLDSPLRRRRRWPLALAAILLTVAVLAGTLIVALIAALFGAGAASSGGCVAGLAPPPPPGTPGAGTAVSAEQRTNANLIVAAGRAMRVPDRGLWVALATALQESGLRNLPGGDRDSLGLFQQRPSQGWGTAAQILDPTYAARSFFTHLLAVPGWQTMPLSQAAQAVQRSAFPGAYDHWQQPAAALLAAAGGTPALCGQTDPATATASAATAIAAAKAQLGKPYAWGATGPAAYDCSGLTMTSWRSAGITLPRTSTAQSSAGPHIPLAQAQPGDLLFWSYNGAATGIHHVALYLGSDQIIEAPETGIPVRIRAVRLPSPGQPGEPQLLPYAVRPGADPTAPPPGAATTGVATTPKPAT